MDTNARLAAAERLIAAYEDRIARLKTALRIGMPADMAISADVDLSAAMDKDRDVFGGDP